MNNLVLLDGNKISGGINYITPECYSTEEREVGCWIDGKPLYQKTFEIPKSSLSSGNNFITNSISNFGQLVAKEVVYNYSNGDMNTDIANPTNNDYRMEVSDVGSSDFTLYIGSSAYNLLSKIFITFYYTKTTDTAGSGDWTPSGIPSVHYSTEEHIVGTWIDGSTLYEKTIEVNSDGNNRWTQVFNDQTANIVSFEGYVLYANGEYGSSSYYSDSNTYCRSLVYDSRHKLQVYPVNTVTASSKIYMTIRYTKSS